MATTKPRAQAEAPTPAPEDAPADTHASGWAHDWRNPAARFAAADHCVDAELARTDRRTA